MFGSLGILEEVIYHGKVGVLKPLCCKEAQASHILWFKSEVFPISDLSACLVAGNGILEGCRTIRKWSLVSRSRSLERILAVSKPAPGSDLFL